MGRLRVSILLSVANHIAIDPIIYGRDMRVHIVCVHIIDPGYRKLKQNYPQFHININFIYYSKNVTKAR